MSDFFFTVIVFLIGIIAGWISFGAMAYWDFMTKGYCQCCKRMRYQN